MYFSSGYPICSILILAAKLTLQRAIFLCKLLMSFCIIPWENRRRIFCQKWQIMLGLCEKEKKNRRNESFKK